MGYSAALARTAELERKRSASSAAMHPMPGCGDRLPIDVVSHIAGCKNSRNACDRRFSFGDDVAAPRHGELSLEHGRRRFMTYSNKHAISSKLGNLARDGITELHPFHTLLVFRPDDPLDHGIPDDFYFGVVEKPFLQNLFRTKRIAAMDHGHRPREICEEQRLLDSGIAAANHNNILAPVEKAVAGRAGRNAKSPVLLLIR